MNLTREELQLLLDSLKAHTRVILTSQGERVSRDVELLSKLQLQVLPIYQLEIKILKVLEKRLRTAIIIQYKELSKCQTT